MNRPPTPEGHEPLYQIFVTEKHPVHGRREIAIGPRMMRRFLEPLMEMIGCRIADGTEGKSAQPWSNPRLELVTDLKHDSPFTREDRANELVGGHRYHPAAV
jgi:hypothetical protein